MSETATPDFKVALADSPRALASIRRIKASGGLLGFALGALGAFMHGSTTFATVVRGLEGGLAGYLVCWFAAVTVWRHVMRAQLRSAIDRAVDARKARPGNQGQPGVASE